MQARGEQKRPIAARGGPGRSSSRAVLDKMGLVEMSFASWGSHSDALVANDPLHGAVGSPSQIKYTLTEGVSDYPPPPFADEDIRRLFTDLQRPGSYLQLRYQPLAGERTKLVPWFGKHTVVLTPNGMSPLNSYVMTTMVRQYEEVWAFLGKATGKTPWAIKQFAIGRQMQAAVAVVGRTVSGSLSSSSKGGYGVELSEPHFRRDFAVLEDSLYHPRNQVRCVDPITRQPFLRFVMRPQRLNLGVLELCNNFWHHEGVLTCTVTRQRLSDVRPEYNECCRRAVALLLSVYCFRHLRIRPDEWRFDPAQAARYAEGHSKVHGHPLGGKPLTDGYSFLRYTWGLYDAYLQGHTDDFGSTLLYGKGLPSYPNSGEFLFVGFLLELAQRHGGKQFVFGLMRQLLRRPRAGTFQEGVDNLIVAASYAADTNLVGTFTEEWHFPISPCCRKDLYEHFKTSAEELRDRGGDALTGGADVKRWLMKMNLRQHYPLLKKMGYGAMKLLSVITPEDRALLFAHPSVSFNPEHVARLDRALNEQRRTVMFDVTVQPGLQFPLKKIPYLWGIEEKKDMHNLMKASRQEGSAPKLPSFHRTANAPFYRIVALPSPPAPKPEPAEAKAQQDALPEEGRELSTETKTDNRPQSSSAEHKAEAKKKNLLLKKRT
jgi:hypothetical protein